MPDAEDGAAPNGDTITVKGGVVTAVTEPAQAVQLPSAIEAKISGLEKVVAQLTDTVSALVDTTKASEGKAIEAAVAQSEVKAEARIMALKNEIGTVHTPKKASVVYAQSVDKEETGFKTITQRMAEKEAARKLKNK